MHGSFFALLFFHVTKAGLFKLLVLIDLHGLSFKFIVQILTTTLLVHLLLKAHFVLHDVTVGVHHADFFIIALVEIFVVSTILLPQLLRYSNGVKKTPDFDIASSWLVVNVSNVGPVLNMVLFEFLEAFFLLDLESAHDVVSLLFA